MKTRLTLLTLLLALALTATAQSISVASFRLLETDLTPILQGTMRTDQNGHTAALIKVVTTQTGFSFDVGVMGIVDTKQEPGEIWVYVPFGVKRITIRHPKYEVLRDYYFPCSIQEARTYELRLSIGTLPPPPDTINQQYLVFQLTPPNAILEVDDQLWEVAADGSAMNFVNFGTYTYRVKAPNYYPEVGKVTVDDPNDSKIVSVSLKSSLVEVTFLVDDDAEIWINNERKGTRSWTGKVGKGTYKVECKKAGHETSTASKAITADMNGQTINLTPPTPIYGSVKIESIPNFATIFIDGKEVGKTPKSIPQILIGQHQLKLTKSGYSDHSQSITITKGQQATVEATLKNSIQVQITSNVASATFSIDGQSYGTFGSSKQRNVELSYGTHRITASAEGYHDFAGTIEVSDSRKSFTVELQSKAPQPLTFTVKGITFKMLPVAGGTFTMGATSEQSSDADGDEKTTHTVTLSDFYMGETEVTQALWQAVMRRNRSHFTGDDQRPVERVSWDDCQTFITKLNNLLSSQLNGKQFRLPTEAEWEYAARGGNQSQGYKYSGSNTIGDVAWYTGNSSNTTHPVAQKQANELGLYDMSGNVYEWCQDWYDTYSSSAQTNPTGPSSGSYRVFRGGSWGSSAGAWRVSNRSGSGPSYTYYDLGLRLSLR